MKTGDAIAALGSLALITQERKSCPRAIAVAALDVVVSHSAQEHSP